MTRLWIAHVLCFTMLNTCVLHLGEQFMESGVKCIKWQRWSYDSQDSHWSIFPSASSDWLRPPHVLVCESMLLWPRVTPVTSVNTRHKLFSSQFTKLPGVTNQHQLTCDPINVGEIENVWAEDQVKITCELWDSAVTPWQMPTRIFAIILSKLP